MDSTKSYFFSGVGGSGMLPLALTARARGATVAGSDRSRDQGRTPDKFAWVEAQGIPLFPQDGTGIVSGDQVLVASAAIEDSVPDVARALSLGCPRMTRAELLAELFNAAAVRIGVGGTSGKSSVTAMTGWLLHAARHDPTIINGAVMGNFAQGEAARFASAVIGGGDGPFVSELDESDGSIALFDATVAVVTNVTLDHKPLPELHALFGDFARRADRLVWNADDAESRILAQTVAHPAARSFGFAADADVRASGWSGDAAGSRFVVTVDGQDYAATLAAPGRHNVSNALAAVAAAVAVGVPPGDAVNALSGYRGIHRRFERVGEAGGVTVIDDFGHNPDKVAATLATVADWPGRLILLFQPHGYGPLKTMGAELAAAFAAGMRPRDVLFVTDPVYFGGTTDRSIGADWLVARIGETDADARHVPLRSDAGEAAVATAQPGDMVIVMGARDDTLPAFARSLVDALTTGATPTR